MLTCQCQHGSLHTGNDAHGNLSPQQHIEQYMTFNWFTISLLGGLFAGIGMIFARIGSQGMPVYLFVGIIGIVWSMTSGGFMLIKQESIPNITSVLMFAIVAALFFWLDNLCRFKAMAKTPITANVLLTMEVVMTTLVITYDFSRLAFQGKLRSISWYEIGGLCLAFGSITLFTLAQKAKST